MIDFLKLIFIENGTIIIWCLYIGGQIIKYFFSNFNKKLIPFLSLFFGVLFMTLWAPAISQGVPFEIRVNRGLVYGFAATGLHELINNIIYGCKVLYYSNPRRDRRRNRNINI